MIDTNSIDRNQAESEFYENDFNFSYSSLNRLLISPGAFYKEYILKKKDDDFKKYLIEGTLIHYLVLEHEGFDDNLLLLLIIYLAKTILKLLIESLKNFIMSGKILL